MSLAEAMDAIQEITHTLDRKQSKDQLDRHILTKNHVDVKTKRRNFKAK